MRYLSHRCTVCQYKLPRKYPLVVTVTYHRDGAQAVHECCCMTQAAEIAVEYKSVADCSVDEVDAASGPRVNQKPTREKGAGDWSIG